MQGSWLTQHQYKWRVQNTDCRDDVEEKVHMWRPNEDGTERMMCRTEMLSNRTMCLIGLIALNKEQLFMDMGRRALESVPGVTIHGAVVDSFRFNVDDEAEKIPLIEEALSAIRHADRSPIFRLRRKKQQAPESPDTIINMMLSSRVSDLSPW